MVNKSIKIPEDWKTVKLGDIIRLEYGRGLTEAERKEGKYPVFGSNGIVGYHSEFLIRKPGIIVGRKGTIGAITWSDENFWPIDTTYFIEVKNKDIDLKWLYFKLIFLDLSRLNTATGTPGLNRDLAYSQIIQLPLLNEQRAIAQVLFTVDEAIQKAEESIQKTERLKKGMMQRLLTRGIGHKKFKETEIGRIPDGWEVEKLDNIAIEITDGSHFSPKEDKKGEYRIATVANIKENQIDIDSCKRISKENYNTLVKNGCKPNKGDILFSKDGTVGLTFTFRQNEDIVLLSSIAIIRPKENLYPEYCAYVLKSQFVWRQIIGSKRGTGLRRIILKDLNGIKIPLPSLPEQQRIASILSAIDKKLELERSRKEKIERIKKGLMNDLLTGRKRVKLRD
jgi:type I restriction enzyme S subunit